MRDRIIRLTKYAIETPFGYANVRSPLERAFFLVWLQCTKKGESFYRFYCLEPQYAIGAYRVDFANFKTHIAIELDGKATHSTEEQVSYDWQRQQWIESQGWTVIRFTGREVFSDPMRCVKEAMNAIFNKYHS